MKINIFSKKGFTLIELLVAVAIVALLATVAAISYRSVNERARDARRRTDLDQIRAALEMYRTNVGTYPATGISTMRTALQGGGYLNSPPVDPMVPSGWNDYSYVSPAGNQTYTLCARLEQAAGTSPCSAPYNYGHQSP